MTGLELHPALVTDMTVLDRLLQLYLYEFTDYTGEEIGPDARYAYGYLRAYWQEPARHPFLLVRDRRPAGFALVREVDGRWQMAEFFVLRKHRREGVGRWAAHELFARFPGPWEVRELAANTPAQAFWRSVIGEIAPGFAETVEDGDVVQRFVM